MDPNFIPFTETIKFMGGAFLGAKLRMDAQNAQLRNDEYRALAEVAKAMAGESNKNSNDAGKRGSLVERIVYGTIIVSVAFGGLILAMVLGKPVAVQVIKPVRSWFFGLWNTGGQSEFISSNGFVLPKYVEESVSAVVGFTFGVMAATVYSKTKRT